MAIKGSLREASLPDVLQLLAMGQKTGCLSVTERSNFGSVYFERGRVVYASIVNRRDRLGSLLVANGVLQPAELEVALDVQRENPGLRLGEILVGRRAITPEQLQRFIQLQVEEAVYLLFTWTQGSFYFEADHAPEPGVPRISINPENLLLEGARRVDEWSLIEKKIPSLDAVFAVDAGRITDDLELTPEQQKILPLLGGEHSVNEVIEASGLVQFEVGKALFGLIQAGVAHPVGHRRAADTRLAMSAQVEEHRNLGLAFFRAGMWDEAVQELRRVAELQPEDARARFHLGVIGLRAGDDRFAMRHLKEAAELGSPHASVFGALALALERMGRLGDARAALEEALRLAPRNPQLLLSYGIVLLKAERVSGACAALARYRAALGDGGEPAAAYFAFAVVAEAMAGRGDAAVRIGREGLRLHPRHPILLLHLGTVHERRGELEVAEELYRRAAAEDAEVPQIYKAVGDALYRRGAHEQAAEAFLRALRLDPELGHDVYFKLGNLYYRSSDREDAARCWRKALQLNPAHAAARTNLELLQRVDA